MLLGSQQGALAGEGTAAGGIEAQSPRGGAMRGRIRPLDPRQAPSVGLPIEPPPLAVDASEPSGEGSLGNNGLIDSGGPGLTTRSEEPGAVGPREVTIASDPPGAAVWIDGRERGQTPLTVRIPAGANPARLVLIRAGYRTARLALDPRSGARIEQTLVRAAPAGGPTGVRVECRTAGRYPIMIDDQDTGVLCPSTPSSRIALPAGTHTVGLYLPERDQLVRKQVMLEETVRSLKFRK